MVEFETIKGKEVDFGNNKFVEIARKKAITEEGETEFVSISRGFITPEGEKRFSRGKNVSLPSEKDVVDEVIASLKDVTKGIKKAKKKESESKEEKEDEE